jgi:transposase
VGSTPRKYTQEYKDEAVRLVLESDRPLVEVAKSLGINESTLGHWVKKAKKDSGADGEQPLSAAERAELLELRKKDAQSQMDIAFLKKVGSAGINRLGDGDGRALRRRSSDPRRPRAMWLLP